MSSGMNAGKEVFVKDGEPLSVLGAAAGRALREGDALVISPDDAWGNPLFAGRALAKDDFHIHARLTLEKLGGTGASFLFGGFYHYPCSRPEGNRTFRVSLDDGIETHDPCELGTDSRIVYGMTRSRAPWKDAKREVVAKTADHIEPGRAFTIDLRRKGREAVFEIDGSEVFRTDLAAEGRVTGADDGGWPACFGFLPDEGVIRLHDLHAEGVFSRESAGHRDVWNMGHDGYFTYRIPSLCVTPGGAVLAFAEARRSDFSRAWSWGPRWDSWNADSVHCVMKRSEDGGSSWSEQVSILARGIGYEARDPAPVVDRETGEILLITRGPYIMKSRDDGESWSEPDVLEGLSRGAIGHLTPGPANSCIQLRNGRYAGRLVLALGAVKTGEVGVVYSDDHGGTWTLGEMSSGLQAYEPQVVELADGRVLVNSRNHSERPGRIISVSTDGGCSFREHLDERLPAKLCEASLLSCAGSAEKPGAGTPPIAFCSPGDGRRALTVRLSDDDCESWSHERVIYSGQSAYSAMAVLPDGRIGVLYEKDAYRRLSFVRFPLSWIRNET